MKKLLIIALAFCSAFSFAQDDRTEQTEMIRKRIAKPNYSPAERAQMQTKQMTLQLDLTDQQQSKVNELLIAHFTKNKGKFDIKKKDRKEMSESERYDMQLAILDSQIELKEKMKSILDNEQYEKYSRTIERFMKKGKGRRGKSRK